MQKKNKKNVLKKTKKIVSRAIAYINATFNNTKITITDMHGNVIAWSSAGKCGFKGSKKGTPFAAQEAVSRIFKKIEIFKVDEIEIKIQGPGQGRDSSIRAFNNHNINNNIKVLSITDITPMPHNGCRQKKKRRV